MQPAPIERGQRLDDRVPGGVLLTGGDRILEVEKDRVGIGGERLSDLAQVAARDRQLAPDWLDHRIGLAHARIFARNAALFDLKRKGPESCSPSSPDSRSSPDMSTK